MRWSVSSYSLLYILISNHKLHSYYNRYWEICLACFAWHMNWNTPSLVKIFL